MKSLSRDFVRWCRAARRRSVMARPALGRVEQLEVREVPAAVVTGTIFQDFNGNGLLDLNPTANNTGNNALGSVPLASDLGLAGVTVTAFDSANVARGSTQTAANGTYTLNATATGPYRIEITGLPADFTAQPRVGSSLTEVNFIPDGSNTQINFAANRPADNSVDAPPLVTNQYFVGANNGPNAAGAAIVRFPYTAGTQSNEDSTQLGQGQPNAYNTPDPTTLATVAQVGATWGLGYNKGDDSIYAAAVFKRHADFGPNGTGAIYRVDPTGATAPTLFADLNTLFGANTAGANLHGANFDTDNGNIGWDATGKTSLGGLDVSEDGSKIYVMNLANRTLYALPVGNGQLTSTAGTFSIQFPPGITGVTGATAQNPLGDLRPFAVQVYRGRIYVGAVNSAESTQNPADLRAYVFEVTDTGNGFVFNPTPLVNIQLNYPRGIVNGTTNPAEWNPWSPVFATVNQIEPGNFEYPQPELTGLAFDANGNISLGLRDRLGDQGGFNVQSDQARPNTRITAVAAGDTLKVFANIPGNPAGGYTLENNGGGPGVPNVGTPRSANEAIQGPGGFEFYDDDDLPRPTARGDFGQNPNYHDELSLGGLLQLPGTPQIISTFTDPARVVDNNNANYDEAFDRGGVRFFDAATGTLQKGYQIYYTQFTVAVAGPTFAKANGLGDLIAVSGRPSIEIGNRVWKDANGDGIQDAGEAPIANVTVQLVQNNQVIATAVTNAQGEYYFRNGVEANANDNIGLVGGAGILALTATTVRIPAGQAALVGCAPTLLQANSGANSGIRDNNFSLLGDGSSAVTFTTGGYGTTPHGLDAGFVPLLSLGNRVFEDANNNGKRDANEAGVAGVAVRLFSAAAPNTVVAQTTTDANGYYLFQGLAQGQYVVEIAPPTGFASSTGTPGSATGPFEPGAAPGAVDNCDNGTTISVAAIRSGVVTLAAGQAPTGEADIATPNTDPTTADNNSFLTVDFGIYRPAALGDRVFLDLNRNGIDDGEPGVQNVRVVLLDAAGNAILNTATDANGNYTFTNLLPGTYSVQFDPATLPAGTSFTAQTAAGSTPANDSNPNAAGLTTPVTLIAGQFDPTIDAGIVTPVPPPAQVGSLSGCVFVDSNNNGILDPGEQRLPKHDHYPLRHRRRPSH